MLAKVALVVFSLLVGLGLAEGLVRVLYPYARDGVIPGRFFVIDDELGWKLATSKTSTHHTRYFDATYTSNASGFRDKPRSVTKIAGNYRALLYGDSLIFGWGLNTGERFSDLWEVETPNLEMWNHGVPGWGLDQEILLYEKEGDKLFADEAIFFVGASTLSRIHTGYIYSKYKPMFVRQQDGHMMEVAVPKGKNAMMGVLYEVFSPFYLPYFLQTQIAAFQQSNRLTRDAAPVTGPMTLESQRLVDEFTKDLLRIAWTTAQKRQHRMTILIANLSRADRAALRALCCDTGIACLEIGPEITATATTDDNSDLVFGKHDKHWNVKANKLIAASILTQRKQLATATVNRPFTTSTASVSR